MRTRKIAMLLATSGASLALIGAGLGASFSDNGTVTENAEVGTFGIELSTATPGAVVSPDKHTVTFTSPQLLSSAPGQALLQFTVTQVGSIPATIAVTQTTLPDPFSSLLASPVPEVLLHQGESHVYDAGIAWTELGNANLGQTASITYAVAAREGPPAAVVAAPTVVEKSCNANDGGIMIPAVAGVDYFIGGAAVAPGFHQRNPGTYVVTAAAQAGFDPNLTGYPAGGWNLAVVQQAQCVDFTLTGSTIMLGGYTVGAAPVVDNVAHTITWTVPVNTPATPTVCVWPCPVLGGPAADIALGRFTVAGLPPTAVMQYTASASVSSGLASQASAFRLGYRSTVYGGPFSNLSASPVLLPVASFDLQGPASYWDDAVGGHNPTDNGVGVQWAGLTGGVTGTVTITLSFSAVAG
jgi:hypothetical protein